MAAPMSPLLILAVGMVVVIGGILVLRLHAFLALILGALVVAALTPKDAVRSYGERVAAIPLTGIDGRTAALKPGHKQRIVTGRGKLLVPDPATGTLKEAGEVQIDEKTVRADGPIPDDAVVIHHTQLRAARDNAGKTFAVRVAEGFGNMCFKIGILIAMAAIVGKCLMDSGAAERLVLGIRRALGEKRAPLAFVGSGFLLGIPVFFDTVFYLLIPLGKALRVRTGRNYLLYVLTIVCGGTMAHSLVPPTPGPLLVAEELGVDLGAMILGGLLLGLCTASSGYLFALWANRRYDVPLRPSAELSEEDLEAMAKRDESDLPGLFVSILPILLPVVLLAGGTAFKMALKRMEAPPDFLVSLKPAMALLGDKNLALTLAAACGLLLLATRLRGRDLGAAVQSALASGGVIILITAAGGAFGYVLARTDIAHEIENTLPAGRVGLLPVAFLLTTIIRTAQGSATVAMITAVGIIAPIAAGGDLPFHPLYLALAIGCGSKPISWMNDSGFWVISRMSGLTEAEMLKTNTIMGCVMALVGLGICMLGAQILPLV